MELREDTADTWVARHEASRAVAPGPAGDSCQDDALQPTHAISSDHYRALRALWEEYSVCGGAHVDATIIKVH